MTPLAKVPNDRFSRQMAHTLSSLQNKFHLLQCFRKLFGLFSVSILKPSSGKGRFYLGSCHSAIELGYLLFRLFR
jgi:hypothetical protein